MTKNVNYLSQKKSKQVVNGMPKLPLANDLSDGELAINYAKGFETIAIKNESGDVVTFSSDNYISTNYYNKSEVDDLISASSGGSGGTYITVNADWDEVDEQAPSFIQNKPFGESFEEVNIYSNPSKALSQCGQHCFGDLMGYLYLSEDLIEGDVYTVDVNGNEMDFTATTFNDTGALNWNGDPSTVETVSVFKVNTGGGSGYCISINDSLLNGNTSTASISITRKGNSIKKLDNKYLDLSDYYTKTEVDGKIVTSTAGFKQVINTTDSTKIGVVSNLSQYYDTNIGESAVIEGTGYQSQGGATDFIEAAGNAAHAEGLATSASGSSSHAEGYYTKANGNYSHAEGSHTVASGETSHAEGDGTTANGNYSHAEGYNTLASGVYSHAEGYSTSASNYSHAEGSITTASGDYSHAEGYYTNAIGDSSHAEGNSTSAMSPYSHTEGYKTFVNGPGSEHAEGNSTSAINHSHAEGDYTSATTYSHAEGYLTFAVNYSHAEGYNTKANGGYSHTEGYSTTASGNYGPHAEGDSTKASGQSSHAEGGYTTASGAYSHAEGSHSIASGESSHAEGNYTTASGYSSHAEGDSTTASGSRSHAEGYGTTASSYYSHAEGFQTKASGMSSHAEGDSTTASSESSHAEGQGTIANNVAEHASGQYNVSNSASTTFGDSGNTLFSVGNGTADNARSNAFEIRQNADIYIIKNGSTVKLQDQLGGGGSSTNVVILTQSEYDALTNKDSNTIYVIK